MSLICKETPPEYEHYRAILEKTGLPYERSMKIIWRFSRNEVCLKEMMPRIEKLAESIEGIKGIEISEDGYSILVRFKQAPFSEEIVLGDFLKAIKDEFSMEEILVQCDVCHRIEQRANPREIIEEFAVNLETFETEPIGK